MPDDTDSLDCTTCGACCVNPQENEAEGFRQWVEVGEREPLRKRKDLMRRLVVVEADGAAHLRLNDDGRCQALNGAIGRRARCTIYSQRPQACRRVQPGDRDCRRYRREQGLPG